MNFIGAGLEEIQKMTEKKGSGIIGEEQLSESIALICCEGDCINGEIVREAANILCE